MRDAVERAEWHELAEEVHRFYSSSSNLGLLRISQLCTDLELAAADPGVDKSELLERLAEACECVLPELERQKTLRP